MKCFKQMQSHAAYSDRVMETETIQKNGASPKSLMSRGNMKFHLLLSALVLPAMIIFSSCGTSYGYITAKVHGTPNVDIYVDHDPYVRVDGFDKFVGGDIAPNWISYKKRHQVKGYMRYLGSTDSNGEASLKVLLGFQDRIGIGKIYAWKSGYQPIPLKLKNNSNILIEMKKLSDINCFQYFDMALNAKKDEEKIKYFQNTIEQDYRNENGIKVQALNNLGIVYSEQKNYHSAYLFLQYALKIDPKNEDVKANFVYLQELAIKQNEDYFRSEEKFNRLIGNMRAVGGALQAVGSSMPSSSSVSSSSGSGSVGYKTLQNKSNSSMLSHPDILARTRSYDGWVTQLINMNTYYETQYNDSNRRYIQEQMRHVREELLAKRGYSYPQSDWETWDGHKR